MRRRDLILAAPALLLPGAAEAAISRRLLLLAVPKGNSPQVQQFFNRLVSIPSAARQVLYANLINGLVADGVWPLLDALLIYAANDSGTATTNLVSSSYATTLVGSSPPTFTTDRGFTLQTTSVNYLNTNFNPSTANGGSANYKQNSAFIAAWNTVAVVGNGALIRSTADLNVEIWPKFNGNMLGMVNGTPESSAANAGDTSGWFFAQRTASNAFAMYRNDTQLGSFATTSAAPENNPLFVGYSSIAGWVASVFAAGASLSIAQKTALYNRVLTYLQGVGAQ